MTDTITSSTTVSAAEPTVSRFLRQIETGLGIDPALFAVDATVDAVVPNWRMTRHGAHDAADLLSGWYDQPIRLDTVDRVALPDGELVELTLTWTEDGVVMTARQSHHVVVDAAGAIVDHRVWCGGRWPAPLVAEMAGA